MEYEGDGDTSFYWGPWNNPQRIDKGTIIVGNKRTSINHHDCILITIGQNSEKSPGILSKLGVT